MTIVIVRFVIINSSSLGFHQSRCGVMLHLFKLSRSQTTLESYIRNRRMGGKGGTALVLAGFNPPVLVFTDNISHLLEESRNTLASA